ncbi:hypothetical protein BST61_g551 [Cercospora zeina]
MLTYDRHITTCACYGAQPKTVVKPSKTKVVTKTVSDRARTTTKTSTITSTATNLPVTKWQELPCVRSVRVSLMQCSTYGVRGAVGPTTIPRKVGQRFDTPDAGKHDVRAHRNVPFNTKQNTIQQTIRRHGRQ